MSATRPKSGFVTDRPCNCAPRRNQPLRSCRLPTVEACPYRMLASAVASEDCRVRKRSPPSVCCLALAEALSTGLPGSLRELDDTRAVQVRLAALDWLHCRFRAGFVQAHDESGSVYFRDRFRVCRIAQEVGMCLHVSAHEHTSHRESRVFNEPRSSDRG